ncbi:hypothetical protein D3C71_827970 [compost metagenome]
MRQLDAIHDRHADIRKKKIETGFLELLQPLLAVCRLMGLVTVETQGAGDKSPQCILIFGNQNLRHQSLLLGIISSREQHRRLLFSRGKHPGFGWVNG